MNTNGSTQVWEIHHDKNSHWTVSGQLEGKKITNAHTMVTPKVNRTMEEQILLEVSAKVKKKEKKKYVKNLKDIHSAEDNLPGYTCMLAKNYKDHKSKVEFPCLVQPKLDGVRCLATKDGMFSRSRNQFSSCPHIQKELDEYFSNNPNDRLDGEFYTHRYKDDFEKIVSAVRKTGPKSTKQDYTNQEIIEYWVYDSPRIDGFIETNTFLDRYGKLFDSIKDYKYINLLKADLAHNEAELIEFKEGYIQEGFEGIIIRNLDSKYEAKRSTGLLKLKDFEDEEFTILKVNEGKGKLRGKVGDFTFDLGNGKTVKAKKTGSLESLKYLYEHPEECIGKKGTIRFQGRTPAGSLRFPVCVAIRDYE